MAEALARTFQRTAELLEESARLADADAQRKALQGQSELEATESDRAAHARVAAQMARTNARRMRERPSRPTTDGSQDTPQSR